MNVQTTGQASPIGEIRAVYGAATATTGDGSRPLALGDPVYRGDVLSTGPKSALEVEFADGTVLSQGQDSAVNLDTYVYDPSSASGDVLFKLAAGTFRMATGAIVDANPDKFKIQSPLATIGIRGTDTGHAIPGDGLPESHGCLDYEGNPVVVQSNVGGPPQVLFGAGLSVGASLAGLGSIQPYTPQQTAFFDTLSPPSMAAGPPSFSTPPEFSAPQQDEPDDSADDIPTEGGGGEGSPGNENPGDDPGTEEPAPPDDDPAPEGTGPLTGQPSVIPALTPPGLPGTGPGSIQGTIEGDSGQDSSPPPTPPPQFTQSEPPEPDENPDDGTDSTDIIDDERTTAPPPSPPPKTPPPTQQTADSEQTASEPEPEESTAGPSEPESGSLKYGGTWSGDTVDYSEYQGSTTGVQVDLSASPQQAEYWEFNDDEHYSRTFSAVEGSPLNDRIFGSDQANSIDGRSGADLLLGGGGDDTIDGGPGENQICGDSRDPNMTSGWGNDTLRGGDDHDDIHGEQGDDLIYGGAGDDDLQGDFHGTTTTGDGNDTIHGESGDDFLLGGGGNDTMYGGPGENEIHGDSYDTSLTSGWGDDTIRGGDDYDDIYGEQGDDLIYGGSGDDDLQGDFYCTTTTGDGNDTIHGESGHDLLLGGGDDTIYGGPGNDDLHGDISRSQTGNDGNDTLCGGPGLDTFNGGGGIDFVSFKGDGFGVDASLKTQNAALIWRHIGVVIDGDTGRFFLDGAEVDHALFTGATGGTITAISLGEPASAVAGTAPLLGLIDDVRFYGRVLSEDDISTLFNAQDSSIGPLTDGLEAYYDFTNGNPADATGNGNNGTVNGADPAPDRFGNADCAYSFDGMGDSIELAVNTLGDFTTGTHSLSLWMGVETTMPEDIFVVDIWDGTDRETLLFESNDGRPYYGWTTPDGNWDAGPYEDITDKETMTEIEGLMGTDYPDTLAGSFGSDTLFGEGGNDLLGGLSGDDVLNGMDGNDELFGGLGLDIQSGGNGNDLFIFTDREESYRMNGTDRTDFITDFTPGPNGDKLYLTGSLNNMSGDLTTKPAYAFSGFLTDNSAVTVDNVFTDNGTDMHLFNYHSEGGVTELYTDVNNDGKWNAGQDMVIRFDDELIFDLTPDGDDIIFHFHGGPQM